jgi:hypothetical protein
MKQENFFANKNQEERLSNGRGFSKEKNQKYQGINPQQ